MKWSGLALEKKWFSHHWNSQLWAQWKMILKSCYPIVSLIVYRRAIKQLIPLKEEKFKTFKGLEDSSGHWKGFKWPSMTVKWPSKSNSNFRWFDTVWLVRKWLRRISLKDSSGCLKPFEASRRPSWRISGGSRRISHEGDPVRINSQILIRQQRWKTRRISLLDQLIWQFTSETIINWRFWRFLKPFKGC